MRLKSTCSELSISLVSIYQSGLNQSVWPRSVNPGCPLSLTLLALPDTSVPPVHGLTVKTVNRDAVYVQYWDGSERQCGGSTGRPRTVVHGRVYPGWCTRPWLPVPGSRLLYLASYPTWPHIRPGLIDLSNWPHRPLDLASSTLTRPH